MEVNFRGLNRLAAKFRRLENPDYAPLMAAWSTLMIDDNRQKILAGEDRYGSHMIAVRYRPKGPTVHIRAKSASKFRNHAKGKGVFGGFGEHPAGLNNNLTRGEYEQLTGPPLAPRGVFSRVITNFGTTIVQLSSYVWEVVGGWSEVVSTKGFKFLSAHFEGSGNLPVRDLRGVRPVGLEKARRALISWLRDQVRGVK
jgi:hypothetical protein